MKKGVLDFYSVAAPKVLGGTCALLFNIALLQFFGPEPFGLYSLCATGILLSDAVLGSAFDLGILRVAPLYRTTNPARALSIQQAAVILKGAAALAVSLGIFLFAEPISLRLFQQEDTEHLLFLTCFAAMAWLLLRSVHAYLQVEGEFVLYGALDLMNTIFKFGGIALILAWGRASPANVLWMFLLGPVITVAVWAFLPGRQALWKRPAQPGVVAELWRYVRWYLMTFAMTSAVSRLDVYLLTAMSTLRYVGLFSAGQAFAAVPEQFGSYISIVLAPRVAPYCREGRFLAFFQKFQSAMLGVSALVFLIAWMTIGAVGPLLLPESFAPSARLFIILLPGGLAAMAAFPLTYTFLMFVRPRFLFVMDAIALPITISLYFALIPSYGAEGAAWVASGMRVLKSAIAQLAAWHFAGNPEELRRVAATDNGSFAAKAAAMEA